MILKIYILFESEEEKNLKFLDTIAIYELGPLNSCVHCLMSITILGLCPYQVTPEIGRGHSIVYPV